MDCAQVALDFVKAGLPDILCIFRLELGREDAGDVGRVQRIARVGVQSHAQLLGREVAAAENGGQLRVGNVVCHLVRLVDLE